MKQKKTSSLSAIMMNQKKRLSVLIPILLLATAPLFISSSYYIHLLILCFVYAVIVMNWNVTVGYLGIFNFAHFAFFAIGAYTSGILLKSFGISPLIGLLSGGLLAVLVALMLALPSLRVRGIYFALLTFAFQQILYCIIGLNLGDLTGGYLGLIRIPPFTVGPINFSGINKIPAYYFAFMIFLLSMYSLYKIINSPIGLSFKALRDSEKYAVGLGISRYKYQIIGVLYSAFFTGVIGGFYSLYLGAVSPQILDWGILIIVLSMLVIGGLGNFYGPIVAAFGISFLSESLRHQGSYRAIIIAILVLVVVITRSTNLNEKIMTKVKNLKLSLGGR